MTVSELNDYYLLEDAIRDTKERIANIEAKLCGTNAFDVSGIPRNPVPQNHVEERFIELAYLKTELEKKVNEYETLKIRIERYIIGIPDLLVSRIARKRVIECKTWKSIADELGGGNTKDSVKMMFYRYIARSPE